jgi:hypothetical protein
MKLIHTSPPAVFTSLKTRMNPRRRYCPTISGCISAEDFVCMGAALNVEVLIIDVDRNFVSTQMLKQFRASVTFGQVTKIYDSQQVDRLPDDEDEDVMLDMFDMNQLPSSLGCFNIRVPRESMFVQTNLVIEGCEVRDITGTVMVSHMDKHDNLMEGLLNM